MHLVTPFGNATCYFVAPDGPDGMAWGCFQDDTGEFWWWSNQQIRHRTSITERRYKTSPIRLSDDAKEALAPHVKRHAP
jgi:hypothetical protein